MPLITVPLFPLHTVLVPGFPLVLHIFEPRYRQMVAECVETEQSFGVCLIREGEEVGAPAVPFDIGTLATLTSVETLPDGRFNILVLGTHRFRIAEVLPPEPYLTARVELLPAPKETPVPPELSRELKELVESYVTLLVGSEEPVAVQDMPGTAERLSWLLTFVLQVPSREKQALLEENDPCARLSKLRDLYARDLRVMRQPQPGPSGFIRPLDADRLGPSPN